MRKAIIGVQEGYNLLKEIGVNVPQDMGFANIRLPRNNPENMNGVIPGYQAMVQTNIDLLVSRINHYTYGVPQVAQCNSHRRSLAPGSNLSRQRFSKKQIKCLELGRHHSHHCTHELFRVFNNFLFVIPRNLKKRIINRHIHLNVTKGEFNHHITSLVESTNRIQQVI